MSTINYLSNIYFQEKIRLAPHFRKKTLSMLRLPEKKELGLALSTYVKDETSALGYRLESQTKIDSGYIIARNEEAIGMSVEGKTIYNDYPMKIETLIANYGDILKFLTIDYRQFQKISLIKCVELDCAMMSRLVNCKEEKQILIAMPDNQTPMRAVLGDYLTSLGYSISSHDMKSYEQI